MGRNTRLLPAQSGKTNTPTERRRAGLEDEEDDEEVAKEDNASSEFEMATKFLLEEVKKAMPRPFSSVSLLFEFLLLSSLLFC